MRLPLLVALAAGCSLHAAQQNPDGNTLGTTPTDAAPAERDAGAPDLGVVAPSSDLAVAGVAGDLASPPAAPDLAAPRPARPSPIAAENARPGSTGWQLTAPSTGLYAFADQQSYLPGDTVEIHAAADAATSASWELWRLGYYGGAGGRRVASGGPVAIPQATPVVMDSSTGMVRATWPVAFDVALDGALVTGVYLVKLTAATAQTYAILVVREAAQLAPIVWPVPFNTYQAYNAFGGTGLYNNTRSDWPDWHAFAVSFDRPYAQGNGAGQLFFADRDFITFVEGQGYDLDYVADSDVDAEPSELDGRALVVLEGHAEYWTDAARSAVERVVANGTNLAAFGANEMFWQVRYAPSPSGAPRREMIGYKEFASQDPDTTLDPPHVTTEWRELGRPENALLGEMFGEWLWSSAPLIVDDPSSWIWTGAGVQPGAMIWGLYGFEIDRRFDNGAEPAGVVTLGHGLGENHAAALAPGQATIYTAPSGATVFASGTISWSQALAGAGRWDARVQQATHNLFARLAGVAAVGDAPAALVLPAGPPAPAQRAGVQVSTVTAALTAPVAVAAAPNGDAIVVDGDAIVRVTPLGAVSAVAGGAAGDAAGTPGAFRGPRGLAVAADGTIWVADTGNHKIKKIVGGVVSTVAGSTEGYAEGTPGKLDQPMSIGLLPSGALVIADVWNQRVRALSGGALSTYAGSGQEASVDGAGTGASFYFPFALAVQADGSVAVAESNDGVLRRIAPDAVHTVSTMAGELGRIGLADGPTPTASLSELAGLAARPNGDLVLLDDATYRVRILGGGRVDTLAGGGTAALVDGDGGSAGFGLPRAAAFAGAGTLYVADTGNHALRRLAVP